MTPELDKVVVIGGSANCKTGVEQLMPQVELGNSAAIIVPHIQNDEIYQSLQRLGVDVVGFEDGRYIEGGKTYVVGHAHDGLVAYWDDIVRGSPRGIGFQNGSIVRMNRLTDSIDTVMEAAAEEFGDKCVGVILGGALDDGAEGVQRIKQVDGKVLVQAGLYGGNESMPNAAMQALKDIGKEADYAGHLSFVADWLNLYLTK